MNKRVKPSRDCVKVRYLQGKGKQKAPWINEEKQTTLRSGFSASEVRQYLKTDSWSEQLYDGLCGCYELTFPNTRLSNDIMGHKYDHRLQRGQTPGISMILTLKHINSPSVGRSVCL